MHWLTVTCFVCAAVMTATANDEAMFEFAKSALDSTATVVRKGKRTRARPSGKTPKVTSTGSNNYYMTAQIQVGKG